MGINKSTSGLFKRKQRYATVPSTNVPNQFTGSEGITIDGKDLTPEEIAEIYFQKLQEFGHTLNPRNIAVTITGVAKGTLHQVFELVNHCKK